MLGGQVRHQKQYFWIERFINFHSWSWAFMETGIPTQLQQLHNFWSTYQKGTHIIVPYTEVVTENAAPSLSHATFSCFSKITQLLLSIRQWMDPKWLPKHWNQTHPTLKPRSVYTVTHRQKRGKRAESLFACFKAFLWQQSTWNYKVWGYLFFFLFKQKGQLTNRIAAEKLLIGIQVKRGFLPVFQKAF